MFSHKHRIEIEGKKLNAFLWRVTKTRCHLIAFFLSKEPFASRAQSPPPLSLSPQKQQQQSPCPISWGSISTTAPETQLQHQEHAQSSDHTLQIMLYLGAQYIFSGAKYPLIRGWIKPVTNLKWHLFSKTPGISPKVPVHQLKLSMIKSWHSSPAKLFL